LIAALKRFLGAHELLYMLVWRDVRVRYKQSVMGLLWAILMPAMIVGAGALVRVVASRFSGQPIQAEDIESVMVRAVAWAFFIGAVRFGTQCLTSNPNLVTKIAFPKEVFPVAAVLSNFFDFLIAFVAVLVIMPFLGWTPTLALLWTPLLLLLLIAFTVGLTLVLSAGNLFFRDVKYIVEAVLTFAIFFTPVLYDASMLGDWEQIIMYNPVAPLLEGISDSVVLGTAPNLLWTAYAAGVSLVLLIGGYVFFKRLESRFAESI
jgi:lipopolysaccharide transport system permease protein